MRSLVIFSFRIKLIVYFICCQWESNPKPLVVCLYIVKFNGFHQFNLKPPTTVIERDNQKGGVNQTTNCAPVCLL